MAVATLELFLRHLRFDGGGVKYATLSDGELLTAYVERGDERAFAELVTRHGPMVLATCRRLLVSVPDAEDAFQATFAVLATKANRLRGDRLPGWLHHVAFQSANRMRLVTMRRIAREKRVNPVVSQKPDDDLGWDELKPILDEELNALPEESRQLLVRHYLMDCTHDQLAKELGIPRGSIPARLKVACEKLRARLKRRGVTAPAIILTAGMTLAGSKVSAALLVTSVNEALAYAKGNAVKPAIAAVASRVLAGLAGRGLKIALVVASIVASVIAAIVASIATGSEGNASSDVSPPQPSPQAANKEPVEKTLTIVSGRVLDDGGRPVPLARVSVLANVHRFGEIGVRDQVLREAVADDEGRFRLDVPQFLASSMTEGHQIKLLAAAPDGRALGTQVVPLRPGVDPAVELVLQASRVIAGRVLTENGQPVTGAVIRVQEMASVTLSAVVGSASKEAKGWPTPTRTDRDGRFELRGVIEERAVSLSVEHADHTYQRVVVPPNRNDALEIRLGPPRRLSGRVVDTNGKPIPSAIVVATALVPVKSMVSGEGGAILGGPSSLTVTQMNSVIVSRNVRADADGRFDFSAPAGGSSIIVWVHPPAEGTDTLAVSRILPWPVDVAARPLGDIRLPSGVRVRGKVIDDAGTPVVNARVRFTPSRESTHSDWCVMSGASASVSSDNTGTFCLTLSPKATGRVQVVGPSHDYVVDSDDAASVGIGSVGQLPLLVHASVPFEVGQAEDMLTVQLRRGQSLEGRAEFPDGTPLATGLAVCHHLAAGLTGTPVPVPVRDGRFAIPGCRPGYTYSVLVLTNDGRHGACARLLCTEADEPEIVLLQPCGRVIGSFQTGAGEPSVGAPVSLAVSLEAEAPTGSTPKKKPALFPYVTMFGQGAARASTGKDGRVSFSGLVPGVKHVLGVVGKNPRSMLVFVPRAGKTLVLPAALVTAGGDLRPNQP